MELLGGRAQFLRSQEAVSSAWFILSRKHRGFIFLFQRRTVGVGELSGTSFNLTATRSRGAQESPHWGEWV